MANRRKRIYYEKMDSFGYFPDGRIKLDVRFKSEDGVEFVWTPPWRAVVDFVAATKYVEETNKPDSKWNEELANASKKIQEKDALSKELDKVSRWLSHQFGSSAGTRSIDRIFSEIKLKGDNKTEIIYNLLSEASNLDEFQDRLELLIIYHFQLFYDNPNIYTRFNEKLEKVSLMLDENKNIVKIM